MEGREGGEGEWKGGKEVREGGREGGRRGRETQHVREADK